jgi:hypothetical protein
MVSILNGNYAGEVGLFVCYTKAKALVNLYNTIGVQSIEGHAHIPSEIKKIIPFDHSSPTAEIGSYFESVVQGKLWIRVKMDQMAAQFVARGLNHESSILIDYWRGNDCMLPTWTAQTSQINEQLHLFYRINQEIATLLE